MNTSLKHRLGAGDGVQVHNHTTNLNNNSGKKRHQVPSSRKFSTNGVRNDANVKRQLRQAMADIRTPLRATLSRRSVSIAEITPSRSIPSSVIKAPNKLRGVSKPFEVQRREDAGRRISHLIVLNAWRRQRVLMAATLESRETAQSEADQLRLQVEVLQALRSSETINREKVKAENDAMRAQLKDGADLNEDLRAKLAALEMKMNEALEAKAAIYEQLMNANNNCATLLFQKEVLEDNLEVQKRNYGHCCDEVDRLTEEIKDRDNKIVEESQKVRLLEECKRDLEEKCVEDNKRFEDIVEKYTKLDSRFVELDVQRNATKDELNDSRSKCDKLSTKIIDMKKLLTATRQMKRKLQDENHELRVNNEQSRHEMQLQIDRAWWLKTGDFLAAKFVDCAYLLFPAMPPRVLNNRDFRKLTVVQNSIAFGAL